MQPYLLIRPAGKEGLPTLLLSSRLQSTHWRAMWSRPDYSAPKDSFGVASIAGVGVCASLFPGQSFD